VSQGQNRHQAWQPLHARGSSRGSRSRADEHSQLEAEERPSVGAEWPQPHETRIPVLDCWVCFGNVRGTKNDRSRFEQTQHPIRCSTNDTQRTVHNERYPTNNERYPTDDKQRVTHNGRHAMAIQEEARRSGNMQVPQITQCVLASFQWNTNIGFANVGTWSRFRKSWTGPADNNGA
jgi:hypothetical protein